MVCIIQNSELYHHGIKGQKWGIRRYQNPDGSLTPEGAKRYAIKDARKEYKKASRNLIKANIRSSLEATGSYGLTAKGRRKLGQATTDYENARFAKADAQIKLKTLTAKNEIKADKEEQKIHAKMLRKADLFDKTSGITQTSMGDHYRQKLYTEKGEDYLYSVDKRSDRRRIFDLVLKDHSLYAMSRRGHVFVANKIFNDTLHKY